MALPLQDEAAWLADPAIVGILEVYDQGACPLTLTSDKLTTAQLGVGPLILSTRDVQDLPFTRAHRETLDRVLRRHGAVVLLRGDVEAGQLPNAITPGTLTAEVVGTVGVGAIPEVVEGGGGFGSSFGSSFGDD